MTRWGLPADAVAISCVTLALVLLLDAVLRRKQPRRELKTSLYLAVVASASLLLSLGYVEYYLRGGPRIIDATSYFLQARTYASGQLGFAPEGAEAAHWGRFLLAMPDGRLSVLFPPGYAAFLALGFLLKQPMLMGPLTAVGLTLGTHWVALRLFGPGNVPRLAAALSACCAVLRYHTADTMSHGLSALLVLLAFGFALSQKPRDAVFSGLALGALVATRPVTALAAGGLVLACLLSHEPFVRAHWRALTLRLAGLSTSLFGIGFFAWQQHEVTGTWFQSSQYRYYALADGPNDCFHYGFAANTGCLFEHGNFIAQYMPEGYGLWEALQTTGRRLALHASDAGNQELFGVLILAALLLGFRLRRVKLLGVGIALHMVLYAGFYFDGNYPGGGARMFADVIPLEHMLIAWLLVQLRASALGVPLMLLGFAFHTAFDHQALREREGGHPMYDPKLVAAAVPRGALLFVSTDHGYALGHDPAKDAPYHVVRRKGDALDFAAWRGLGSLPAFSYEFDLRGAAPPRVFALSPRPSLRFEAERQWPPFDVDGGWAMPTFSGNASAGGSLTLEPAAGGSITLELALWVERKADYRIAVAASEELLLVVGGAPLATTLMVTAPNTAGLQWTTQPHPLEAGNLRLRITANRPTLFDYVELLEP